MDLCEVKNKFDDAAKVLEDLITEHVGEDNYAGSSSLKQLDRIAEKFYDCALQDLVWAWFTNEMDNHDLSGANQTGTVTVERSSDGQVIKGVYRVSGGKGHGYEIIRNTTGLTDEQAEAVLSGPGNEQTGEWKVPWDEAIQQAKEEARTGAFEED